MRGKKEIKPFTRIFINLEKPSDDTKPPHVEDWFIGPGEIGVLGYCTDEEKLRLLVDNCSEDVKSIFEAEIHHVERQGTFIKAGTGKASLGTVRVKRISNFSYRLYEENWDYRATLQDQAGHYYRLKFVDLSFQTYIDHLRICQKWSIERIINHLNDHVFAACDIYVRIGLARGWADYPDCCNLQITGFFPFPDYMEGLSPHSLRQDIKAAN